MKDSPGVTAKYSCDEGPRQVHQDTPFLQRIIYLRKTSTDIMQVQGVQKFTKPMAYMESVSWTLHFKEIVASTIAGLKPP
jgi:hypothetical protein